MHAVVVIISGSGFCFPVRGGEMEGYSVQSVLGEGSFGKALVVQCKHSGQHYVLKQIRLPMVRV